MKALDFRPNADIRKTAQEALDKVNAAYIGQSAASIGYATKADLDADLTPADGILAIVTNDATATNNGTYRKSGATGTGSWVQSSYDRITLVQQDISAREAYILHRINLFNPALVEDGFYYNDTSGTKSHNDSFATQIVSGLQEVKGSTTYSVPLLADSYSYIEFDENKAFIQRTKYKVTSFTTAANTKFVGFTWLNSDTANATLLNEIQTSFMMNEGAELLPYEPYDTKILNDELLAKSETIKDLNKRVPTTHTQIEKNKFDKDSVLAGYLYSSSGEFSPDADSGASDYISVVEGQNYTISGRNVSNTKCIVFYDVDKNILPAIGTSYEDVPRNGTVKAPAGAAYVRFTVAFNGQGTWDTVQWEEGASATEFEPYYKHTVIDDSYLPVESNDIAEKITIKNSDKIGIFGNSYSQGYVMKGKHWTNMLGMFLDYSFRNFGVSGDDLLEILKRVRDDDTEFGSIPVSQWGLTYGLIVCRDNNGATYNADIDTYYENTKKLAYAIETLGARPMLSTEHQKYTFLFNSLERLSREKGYMFMNWGKFADAVRNHAYFSPIYFNGHPATRTTWLWVDGMKKYLETLPRPKKGIKLFRVRPSVDTTDIQNLIYETTMDRAERYVEFITGNTVLDSATEKYFDRLQETLTYESAMDEYQKIQNQEDVVVGDYLLSELILPFTSQTTKSVQVNVSITGATKVYVKRVLGLTSYLPAVGTDSTYLAHFKEPVGEWFEIPMVNGVITVPLDNTIMLDKISLLFEGAAMTLSNISVECSGTEIKDVMPNKTKFIGAPTGIELLADTLLDDNTAWTDINTLTSVPKVVAYNSTEEELFPKGVTTVREITNADELTQLIDASLYTNDDYHDTEIEVRVLCRYFPEYTDTDAKAAASVIKRDSFDCAKLEVGVLYDGTNQNVKVATELVGLYWQEISCTGVLQNTSTNKLVIKTLDKPIQIAKVSVRKVGE